jgi:hypothetical protein
MLTPQEKQEMRARLLATLRPKPKPQPTARQLAEKRFNEANKPTAAIIQDNTAANEAMRRRIEYEQVEARNLRYQAIIDEVWKRNRDYQAALNSYAGTCHRGPGDPDWGW